ncbi:MAG TPA: L-histidine N(alpha)-methyltransferase [Pseudomonadota bacterium]|nr:L-histidine N(alpha)-methyltransferase [Pseudomonadota bacterium]
MQNEALSSAAPSRQQQLATIHAQALALASQLESFAAGEPMAQQATWTEYAGMLQDVVHFSECAENPDSTKDELLLNQKHWQSFGRLLRDRREAAGFSRSELSRLAKLSDATVKFAETARYPPSRKTLIRLLAVPQLNLTWDDLPWRPGAAPQVQPSADNKSEAAATDLNWYVTPTFEPVRMVMELGRFLNGAGGHVEQTSAYLDHQSAAAYLAMCERSPVTAAARGTMQLGVVAKRIVKETKLAGLNVIALGSGDAHLEVRLVQHLAQEQATPDIRFCLFDISQPLLSAGFKYAKDALCEIPGVSVWALQGNFHHLPLYTQLHYSPASARRRRIYCILGNTLANLDNEPRFFQHSFVECVPGDLLVLDVQQAHGPADNPEEIRRRDPGLLQPFSKIHAEWLAGPIYRHCKDVVGVEFSMQLDTQCPLPGSYALDAIATVKTTGRPEKRFSMFRFKRYDVAKLAQCLAETGWEQLAALPSDGAANRSGVTMLFCKRDVAAVRRQESAE